MENLLHSNNDNIMCSIERAYTAWKSSQYGYLPFNKHCAFCWTQTTNTAIIVFHCDPERNDGDGYLAIQVRMIAPNNVWSVISETTHKSANLGLVLK